MSASRAREVKRIKRAPLPHVRVDGKHLSARQVADGTIVFEGVIVRGRRFSLVADFSVGAAEPVTLFLPNLQWGGYVP